MLIVLTYRKVTARRLRLARLNVKVQELELTAIRAQMNPHFLYNSLNSIQNLIQKKLVDEAYIYLSKFASLIRNVLKNSSKEEIPLYEELEMIKEYIKLEQLRFDFDFEVIIDKQVDLYSIYLPPLLLQPLVENAIIHGLAGRDDKRKLKLKFNISGVQLFIEILDNGIGREQKHKLTSGGKGLKFSEERLNILTEKYGERYVLEVVDLYDDMNSPIGTLVKIIIPTE